MSGGIYLLLGSNLGDRFQNLAEARDRIGSIQASSSIYVTRAWGNTHQPDFYNQVIEIDTQLTPEELLKTILKIEASMGRVRDEKWGARIIDIDILFYRNKIIDTEGLIVPHPEIKNRRFTLIPLREITNMIHPVLRKTIDELLKDCQDPLEVTRLQPPQ